MPKNIIYDFSGKTPMKVKPDTFDFILAKAETNFNPITYRLLCINGIEELRHYQERNITACY